MKHTILTAQRHTRRILFAVSAAAFLCISVQLLGLRETAIYALIWGLVILCLRMLAD